MTVTPGGFDMAERRRERAKARAAKQEARGDTYSIRNGDTIIAVLESEFPLDVLEPLTDVNLDIALVVEQAMEMVTADTQEQQAASMDLIAKVLGANPNLFREVIDAIKAMGLRLFGPEGYAEFVRARPTPWDVADLARDAMSWYGVSLGESSRPSAPSSGGAILSPTSSTTTDSTPVESGASPATPGSSESDGSPT